MPFQIHRIPVLSDNYVFMLHDPHEAVAAVVDPAEATPVLSWLSQHQASLTAIFNTHHHGDHVGGNRQLLKRFPHAVVYASQEDKGRIPGQHIFLEDGDRVEFGHRAAHVYFVPGHTRGHIAYYFLPVDDEPGDLFCGDTLFAGGCGRLFEGTPGQMVTSLAKLRALPDSTRIWCAHEYTLNNLKFALTVDGDNDKLQHRFQSVKRDRQAQIPTIPTVMGIEKQTNPFLRWDQPAIQSSTGYREPVRTFGKLRGMKDLF